MTLPGTERRFDRYAYPRLRPFTPVLRRGPGELQVGLDQDPALILTDVQPGLADCLALLDGCHSSHEIRQRGQRLGLSGSIIDWTLRMLDAAYLLSEGQEAGGSPSGLGGKRVRLVGAGRLGQAIGELLVCSGISALYVIDAKPTDLTLYPAAGALGSQAEAFQSTARGTGRARIMVENHWSKPEGIRPHITVIACDELEPDRVLAEGLVRADEAHLFVRCRAGGVVVGPLVVPGQTACLRCTDLSRRDADPAWPTLLTQLCRIKMGVASVLVAWGASAATAEVLGFLSGATPETHGCTVEMFPDDFVPRHRSWSMHPGCGCGWGLTAQWGA